MLPNRQTPDQAASSFFSFRNNLKNANAISKIPHLQNHLRRTLHRALSTVGALLIINHSQVVLHMDGVELALLGAEGTADTASRAGRLHVLALVVGVAAHQVLGLVGHQLDQMVGAGSLSLIHI